MMRWRLLRSTPMTGAFNMALDETLLESVAAGRSRPVLRLYRWSPPTVSIGYAQSAAVVDAAACGKLGIDIVRRPTGGRAVLHDREATYAVIASERHSLFSGRLLETYHVIARPLQRAMAVLGVTAELVSRQRGSSRPGSGICFTAPSTWELVFDGHKVAGSAQKRAGGAFLQHGSIPVELDLELLNRVLGGERGEEGDIAYLSRNVGWLNRWLVPPVSVEMVENALIVAFEQELKLHLVPDEPTCDEWDRARQLAAEKYGNPAWTWKNDPRSVSR